MPDQSLATAGPFGSHSLLEVAKRIRHGETSAAEITEHALAAAHEYGQELNCFVTIDDEGAARAARLADREHQAGLDRGPLHGIPVGVKDVIATSGLATTMGSAHFAHHVPVADAVVVTALRSSGAVIIGKTQTHEFAYGPTSDRAATGAARNPHDRSLMTGGSSGGSGAAVAAGIVPVALGTDTGGSVRVPAALCGVVGMRPTQGALSSDGVFPLSPSMDVVGPLAANVADTAAAWWALSAGVDYRGTRNLGWSQGLVPDPARAKPLRFGQVGCALVQQISPDLHEALETAVQTLRRFSAHVPAVAVPELDSCADIYKTIQSAEAFAIHTERMERAPELFDPEVLERLQAASSVRGWEYVRALETRNQLRSAVLHGTSSADILIAPTVPVNAPALGQRELAGEGGWTSTRDALLSMTSPWSVLGFPAVSLPVPGNGSRLPRSVQLIAKPGQERQLLDAAAMLEEGLSAGRT
jgi:aspartyl-tRNA(Asn)/glutamyl-tRNA(Gln) amidotransferase subunit A